MYDTWAEMCPGLEEWWLQQTGGVVIKCVYARFRGDFVLAGD